MSDSYRERSALTIYQAMTALVAVGAIVAAIALAFEIILTIFFGVLFGVFLVHSTRHLGQWIPLARGWILAGLVAVLLALGGGMFVRFFTQINRQIGDFSEQVDEGAHQLRDLQQRYPFIDAIIDATPFLKDALATGQAPKQKENATESGQPSDDPSTDRDQKQSEPDATQKTDQAIARLKTLEQPAQRAASFVGGFFTTTFGLVVNSVLIFFVGLFLAMAPTAYRDGLVSLFPPDHRERTTEILNMIGHTLWRWLLGRFGSMLATGIGAASLLWLLGVPMAGTLGIITALLTFIPNIGAAIALVLAVMFALPQGLTTAMLVVPTYVLLQLVESYVVTPLIQQKQVSLPPALLIAFQAVMGVLFGLLGAAVASPLLAAGKVAVEQVYIKDILEKKNG